MKVAVLGCGPAGLMAVHALKHAGVVDVAIYSKPRKSEMFGAQYLHAPIPGATTSAPVTIRYRLEGTADGYRAKVYGVGPPGMTVSPEEYGNEHDAWDIRSTYDELWKMYGSLVEPWVADMTKVANLVFTNDLVISSIPAPYLCVKEGAHTFHAQEIQALGDAPERGQTIPYKAPKNTVICNGEKDVSWYRLSNLFGYNTVEWSSRVQVPLKGVATLQKPLWTNCDCFPTIIRVGRFGRWEKGVLSHTAYQDTLGMLVHEQS